jgi:WD40 repeat protein
MAQLDLIITPTRVFEDNTQSVFAAANVPNSQLVVTASEDKLVRLWDLKTGQVLKKMGGHTSEVVGLAVSRDGQMIATGDKNGELIVWSGKNGEPITKAMKAHDNILSSLDFQRDGPFLITASSTPSDQTMKFWNTDTWTLHTSIQCGSTVRCVRFSVCDNTEPIFRSSHSALSLAWYPDGTRLLSGGDDRDPSIREWDTSSWTQVGLPWTGHIYNVNSIAVNSSSTHAVSALLPSSSTLLLSFAQPSPRMACRSLAEVLIRKS